MIVSIISIFIFGYLGSRIFAFLRIPGGFVTGSLITLAILTSQGFKCAELHWYFLTFLQIILGITIGCRIKKEQISIIKSFIIPGLISSVWMIFICITTGFFMAKIIDIDLGTALYASVPGGLSEMGLIALSLDLNVPIVTLLQFIRVISISLSLPLIASTCHIFYDTNCRTSYKSNINEKTKVSADYTQKEKTHIRDIFLLLFFGSIGGLVGKYTGIPVGGMLGSMFTIGVLRIIGLPLKELPLWLIQSTQIMLGGYMGTTFIPEILSTLKSLLIPVLFFSFFVVLNGVIMGIVFHKVLKWDLSTALLATSAGGITLMTLTAIEIKADPVKVSIIQTFRIVIILLIMPTLILKLIL